MAEAAPSLSDAELLTEKLNQHVKTNDTRRENWEVFGFETQVDEKYARAQYRYVGTSGTVDHRDSSALMGEHFTLTIIRQPPGHIQPIHVHPEEEVFFVLEGSPTIVWETKDGEQVTRRLNKWDMVYNPSGWFCRHCWLAGAPVTRDPCKPAGSVSDCPA